MTDTENKISVEKSLDKLLKNINSVFYGRENAVRKVIMAFIAGGHILLEDVPGVGKTLLAKVIAKSINAKFKRVQCTPDLLPTDISGVNIYNQKLESFKFMPGPIFTNLLLVDEINRAAPRTQSCFLEVMEELQTTIDGQTYKLIQPFFVIATQNPVEHHGTFNLPESQLDRFLMIINLGYPERAEEINVMKFYLKETSINVDPVITIEEYMEIHKQVKKVTVSPEIMQYIMDIVKETRNNPKIKLGMSTRGALSLLKVAQASALVSNRNYVIPDDILNVLPDVVSHRIMTYENYDSVSNKALISSLTLNIKVPIL
jgi:MoxR-like ATPase